MNKQELLHYLNKLQWACDELGKVGRDEEAGPFVAKMEKAINTVSNFILVPYI